MQVTTKIQKLGNGLALRVSGVIREIPNFRENTPVIVEVTENGFSVTKLKQEPRKLPFSEQQLLDDLNPHTGYVDIALTPLDNELEYE